MAIDHISIYVKIGIECPEGETKVPESEHIAISERIYDDLREQTTSDDYDGCLAGSLIDPDLMVEVVSPMAEKDRNAVLIKIAADLVRDDHAKIMALLSRIPSTLLTAYLHDEF